MRVPGETMPGAGYPAPETLEKYAGLIVQFGANVQPGQIVSISCEPEHLDITRAVADAAYRAKAKFVDIMTFDSHIKSSRIRHADPETLSDVPPWMNNRMLRLGEERAARIGLISPMAPEIMAGLDPELVARDQLPWLPATNTVINEGTTNWAAAPAPTMSWARSVFPDMEPDAAYRRLWDDVLHMCRADTADPVQAWNERLAELDAVAGRLTERRFDALHFEGPGTDLTVGLLPTSRWTSAREATVGGITHVANMPTEEVFTAPDPEKTEGHVAATKPLVIDGQIIPGLQVEFKGGRAVSISADENEEVLRQQVKYDEGARRLGEIALVDGNGRVGPLDTVYLTALIDEDATSHAAFGDSYASNVGREDRGRINSSAIHIDFMLGSPEMIVRGISRARGTRAQTRTPVLERGVWRI